MRALSVLGIPTRSEAWSTWRCRLLSSTTSSSTRPMVPIPDAARYIAAGEPSPPAPISSTLLSRSLRCPAWPISGISVWRL